MFFANELEKRESPERENSLRRKRGERSSIDRRAAAPQ